VTKLITFASRPRSIRAAAAAKCSVANFA